MKEKLIPQAFKCPPHIAEKLHRDSKSMGLTKTAYIIMLIAKGSRK